MITSKYLAKPGSPSPMSKPIKRDPASSEIQHTLDEPKQSANPTFPFMTLEKPFDTVSNSDSQAYASLNICEEQQETPLAKIGAVG
ncbi:uncharacterized protein KY384_003302 [Bacidia gigantensis]|uniref:uncharacterized protein n=1 Tax=Bacidia gigantensis TaxID=2732470 RepID=UPI001D03C3A5|nr:uncharacterized protein KY384_003302 [Bacidia gigantensis]KAG8531670.1 hypothetical protein KY384_003302 [Bacidia gigantensis]